MSYIDLGNISTVVESPKDYSWLGGLAGAGVGLVNSIYNMYTNKRDFDYQKALQKTMFEREDTAVQRRVADLKAAGINPNLAAGSAASAGAVVSRSNTNDVNMGAALDNIAAISQIKSQRIQNQILQQDKRYATVRANQASMDYETNAYYSDYDRDFIRFLYGDDKNIKQYNPRLWQYFNNMVRDQQNSTEILEKQNNWYNAKNVIDALTSTAGAVNGAVNAGASVKRASNAIKRLR